MDDFAAARTKMVDSQVRTVDVTDRAILSAMGEIPRERFVPPHLKPLAYIDADIRLTEGTAEAPPRYLMEAGPLARLLQLAEIDPGNIVLDVGCATGYSTAILARLADSVIGLETDPDLAAEATAALVDLGIANAAIVAGPLEAGCPAEAPFDVILVGGAVEVVPEALLDQLKEGGRLVAVVGYGQAGLATCFTRTNGEIGSRRSFNAHIHPLPGFSRPKAFVF